MPSKQCGLIRKDGVDMATYIARTIDGVAQNSHLRTDNYFYHNCLTGKFARDCCPSYLQVGCKHIGVSHPVPSAFFG